MTRRRKINPQQAAAPAVTQAAPAPAADVFVCSHLARGVRFDMPDGRQVRIAGVNDHLRGKEKGILAVGGGVYTRMKAADWEHISKVFADWQAVKNGLLYAETSAGRAKAAMRERSELRNGFEPVNPEADVRVQPAKASEVL